MAPVTPQATTMFDRSTYAGTKKHLNKGKLHSINRDLKINVEMKVRKLQTLIRPPIRGWGWTQLLSLALWQITSTEKLNAKPNAIPCHSD